LGCDGRGCYRHHHQPSGDDLMTERFLWVPTANLNGDLRPTTLTGAVLSAASGAALVNGTAYRPFVLGAPGPVTTPASGATAPAQVTGLGSAVTAGQVVLTWTAPADGGSAITGYRIERRTGTGSWADLVADTGTTAVTYTDTTIANLTAYNYRVSAINAVGTGTASEMAWAFWDSFDDRTERLNANAAWEERDPGTNTMQVASGYARADTNTASGRVVAGEPTAALYAEVPFEIIDASNLATQMVRAEILNAAFQDGYGLFMISNGTWEIRRITAGSGTTIASGTVSPFTLPQSGTIRLTRSAAGVLTGALNGDALGTVTDTTHTAALRPGFRINSSATDRTWHRANAFLSGTP
jgi:hypothetical protein